MKPPLHSLKKQLAQAADALRFADAGEFMPLATKTALIGTAPGEPPRTSETLRPEHSQSRRKVALLAEQQIGKATLKYALNVCERMDAELEVLVGRDLNPSSGEIELARSERPVSYQIQRLGPNFLAQVARYIAGTSGLLFVVTAANDEIAERIVDRSARRLKIPDQVPWVIVAG